MTEKLLWLLTGGALPCLLLLCSGYFFLYLKGLPWRRPRKLLAALTRTSSSGVSPFRSVTLALAGTLGVGNIVGVANAIAVGGAGAVLWMWGSALAAMILKYAEILLAVRHRRTNRHGHHTGGAVYYIRDALEARCKPRLAGLLSGLFACLMVLNALSMGCVIQANAVSSVLDGVLGVPPLICALLLGLLTLPMLRLGPRGISAFTEYLVPIMSAGYLILSATVLILRWEAIPHALEQILQEAFTPRGATGGVVGVLTSSALRSGTMRGLLSNEAGCGTAPTAHASANTDSPAAQGVWGIFEVFADTILLCSLTALVILVAPFSPSPALSPVMLTVKAYSSVLGGWSELFFCGAVFCFGYATVVCWGSYGGESLGFLTRRRSVRMLYSVLFLLCIPLGCFTALDAVWTVSDLAITALTTVNLVVLLLLRREIREETQRFFIDKTRKP